MQFRYAIRAIQGGRSYQEDTAAVWERSPSGGPPAAATDTTLLAILADGMGGHAGGALASTTIAKVFEAEFLSATGSTHERLAVALQRSNEAIKALVESKPGLRGMGATLIGVAFTGNKALWISVGDSPLYIYRAGQMARINEDHSMGPLLDRLVAAGKLTEEESRTDPRRHLLRSAVSGDELELIDLAEDAWPMLDGDVMVLASDGIHTLEDQEIARLIAAYRNEGPEAIADALLAAVGDRHVPHQDNTTVVVVSAAG